MALMAGLGLGAWHLSGDYFAGLARQQAADRWDELRVCLLGDALRPGDRPSERVRFIRLAAHTTDDGEPWPERCAPYAKQLDEALATRAVMMEVGPLPSAATIVAKTDDAAARDDLDLLFGELEMADLPLAKHRTVVVPAPMPAKPVLAQEQLITIGRVLELKDVTTSLDPGTGHVLRMLLPEAQVNTCHFHKGPIGERWASVICEASPLPVPRGARLSLTPAEEGGLDLIRVRESTDKDGIYDARTGLLVLKPHYFDTQTHVAADGRATILYAQLGGDDEREEVEHFRLLQSSPGKRPVTRRLRLPETTKPILAFGNLLFTIPGERKTGDMLVSQKLAAQVNRPLEKRVNIGPLPFESRYLDRCSDGDKTVLLFGAGLADKHYALVMHDQAGFKKPTDIGTIAGHVTLSCHDGKAMLLRIQHQRVSRWQCTSEGCEIGLSEKLPMLESRVHAVAPIGLEVLVLWKDERGALRSRLALPETLAKTPDTVVLDEWKHGGIEMTELSTVSGSGLAMVLAQDVGRRVYALRFDASGQPMPVKISR
jgi:hypothetical protein